MIIRDCLAEYIKSHSGICIEVSPINIPENYNIHEDFKDFLYYL